MGQDAKQHADATPPCIGRLQAGPTNTLSDVPGVTVGHTTLADGATQTGVTVIRAHAEDPYRNKVPAAVAVINGFGKSIGLVQLEELGQMETPIALTNTFSVAAVAEAQIRHAIAANPDIGRGLPTVNALVLECNDGYLNDIQQMRVSGDDYLRAHEAATATEGIAQPDIAQGAVGAGRGMSSFQMKGGIGTASRQALVPGSTGTMSAAGEDASSTYTVGALVLANYGILDNLIWDGAVIGTRIAAMLAAEAGAVSETGSSFVSPQPAPEKGSIIMVLATDAPLDARQLRRLAMRAAAGLARTGSCYGHGSGDIALAFSTAYTIPHTADRAMPAQAMLHETRLDRLFQAAADAVEQAIVHALWHAEPVVGREGHRRDALRPILARLKAYEAARGTRGTADIAV